MEQHHTGPRGHAPVIRVERPDDIPAIRALHDEAFGGTLEGSIVDAMRGGDHWIDGGSLVATDLDDAVVGHVLLSLGWLTQGAGDVRPVWMLGPIGVRPDRQRQGVGGALMRAAIDLAISRGQPVICLVGHDTYYPRFGFESGRSIGILPPNPAWSDVHWMALRLPAWTPDIQGTARYAPEFPD